MDYLSGRPVAALVYRHNQHFINAFVWPGRAGGGKPESETRRGFSVINRETGGWRYCLVSDLNEKELAKLATLLER